jgi:hypothetical protein
VNNLTELVPTHRSAALADFAVRVTDAVAELNRRLQAHYQRVLPDQTELVRAAIADAEARAWQLSSFPHLFLPDLVEARIAELALQPTFMPREASYPHAA